MDPDGDSDHYQHLIMCCCSQYAPSLKKKKLLVILKTDIQTNADENITSLEEEKCLSNVYLCLSMAGLLCFQYLT